MTPEEYAQQLLNRIGNATKMGGKGRIPVGQHRLALLAFGFQPNQKTKDNRLQADFVVVQSTTLAPDAKCSVSFFVERTEYPKYEDDRCKSFIEACGACVSDQRGTPAMGADLMTGKGRGIVLDCLITPDTDEQGQPKRGKKGNVYTSETWTALPQTWADVEAAGRDLTARFGAVASAAPAQNRYQGYAAAPQAAQPNYPAAQTQPQTTQSYAGPATPAPAPAAQPAGAAWGTPPVGGSLLTRR